MQWQAMQINYLTEDASTSQNAQEQWGTQMREVLNV